MTGLVGPGLVGPEACAWAADTPPVCQAPPSTGNQKPAGVLSCSQLLVSAIQRGTKYRVGHLSVGTGRAFWTCLGDTAIVQGMDFPRWVWHPWFATW